MVTVAMKLRFLGRKAMKNLDSILKSRDITWLTNVCVVKTMVFPAVMHGCESWTVKKAEGCRAAQLASIRQMSGQVSRGSAGEYQADEREVSHGSAGEYQADERAGVARLSWRVSGR